MLRCSTLARHTPFTSSTIEFSVRRSLIVIDVDNRSRLFFRLAIGGFDDDGNGMLSIESYDVHCDQWTILTSIPGAISKTWPQSLGTVGRRIYISVFHTSNSFIVMQEGYFYDLNTSQWSKAPVVHERARYCPTVQLRFPRNLFNKSIPPITNSASSSPSTSMPAVSTNLLLMNTQ